eukprot:tig00020904_g15165.t1
MRAAVTFATSTVTNPSEAAAPVHQLGALCAPIFSFGFDKSSSARAEGGAGYVPYRQGAQENYYDQQRPRRILPDTRGRPAADEYASKPEFRLIVEDFAAAARERAELSVLQKHVENAVSQGHDRERLCEKALFMLCLGPEGGADIEAAERLVSLLSSLGVRFRSRGAYPLLAYYIQNDERDKWLRVLQRHVKERPDTEIPPDRFLTLVAKGFAMAGMLEEARVVLEPYPQQIVWALLYAVTDLLRPPTAAREPQRLSRIRAIIEKLVRMDATREIVGDLGSVVIEWFQRTGTTMPLESYDLLHDVLCAALPNIAPVLTETAVNHAMLRGNVAAGESFASRFAESARRGARGAGGAARGPPQEAGPSGPRGELGDAQERLRMLNVLSHLSRLHSRPLAEGAPALPAPDPARGRRLFLTVAEGCRTQAELRIVTGLLGEVLGPSGACDAMARRAALRAARVLRRRVLSGEAPLDLAPYLSRWSRALVASPDAHVRREALQAHELLRDALAPDALERSDDWCRVMQLSLSPEHLERACADPWAAAQESAREGAPLTPRDYFATFRTLLKACVVMGRPDCAAKVVEAMDRAREQGRPATFEPAFANAWKARVAAQTGDLESALVHLEAAEDAWQAAREMARRPASLAAEHPGARALCAAYEDIIRVLLEGGAPQLDHALAFFDRSQSYGIALRDGMVQAVMLALRDAGRNDEARVWKRRLSALKDSLAAARGAALQSSVGRGAGSGAGGGRGPAPLELREPYS